MQVFKFGNYWWSSWVSWRPGRVITMAAPSRIY